MDSVPTPAESATRAEGTMSFFEVALALLLFVAVIGPFVPRTRLPMEVVLVLASLIVSFIPGLPDVHLDTDLVFRVFLPPILFAAAYFTSWRDFRASLRPIVLLAFGLVLFTATGIAAVCVAMIPGFTWAQGFLLGAIISPPDAAAATAITRKLGVPRRLITLLEGESLLNDASALVLYRFALAAVLTGAFSLWSAAGQFALVSAGGVAVGLLVAAIAFQILKRLEDPRAQTILTLVVAYGCYIFAERLQVSGVISAVTGGLYFGRMIPVTVSAQTRIEAKAIWDAVLFVIDGLVFTLIGLQLPSVVKGVEPRTLLLYTGYAVVLSAAVILVRLLWIFPATYIPRWLSPAFARRDPAPPWNVVVVLGWTGMRGIVSLAAVLAIPQFLPSGESFPDRSLLVFLTYAVILVTLLLPALTLPRLKVWLRLEDGGERQREEAAARIASAEAVVARASLWRERNAYPRELVDSFRARFERRLRTIRSNVAETAVSTLIGEDLAIRRMTKESIEEERRVLGDLRRRREIHDEVFHQLNYELDIEEMRLRTQRL